MAADKQNKQQKQNQQKNESKPKSTQSSLVRFSKIPVVEFTVFLTLNVYNRVKSSSDLLSNTLNRAEKFALYTLDSLKPVTNKLERQISYVDSVGNAVLDRVEQTVPVVTSFDPKNAYANSMNRVNRWRKYTTDKVNAVRNFSLTEVVNRVFKEAHSIIDDYYPGTAEEMAEAKPYSEETVTGHFLNIGSKLKNRSLLRLQNIQRLLY